MKQYTQKEFIKICVANGFYYNRHNGDHAIYVNDKGRHISIPNSIESVIAQRLIKENNLETDIKKIKRDNKMDNYPIGARDNPKAPYNEALDVKHRRFVSLTISYYTEVEGPPDMRDECVEEQIRKNVMDGNIPKEFDIDELVIIND